VQRDPRLSPRGKCRPVARTQPAVITPQSVTNQVGGAPCNGAGITAMPARLSPPTGPVASTHRATATAGRRAAAGPRLSVMTRPCCMVSLRRALK
jgi:hypothetical protein